MDTNIETTELDIETIKNNSYKATQNFDASIKAMKHTYSNYIMALNDKVVILQSKLDLSNKTITELQESIDKKVKAAYKDGYGAALQKVLSIVKKIDNMDTKNTKTDIIDNYLSLYKGDYILGIEDIKETKHNIIEILSHVFQDASPLQIDLWLQKNVVFSRGWTNLLVGINEDLCLKISKIINENKDKYKFVKFGYWLRQK